MATIAAAANASPDDHGETANHDPFSQTLTPVQLYQPRVMPPVISLPRPAVARAVQQSSNESGNSDQLAAPAAAASQAAEELDEGAKTRRVSYKIPRYTRRYHQSRSEPSDSSSNTMR